MFLLFKQSDERGQGLVEYALILVLVAIVVIAALLLLGPTVSQVYCRVATTLQPGSCGVSATLARTGPSNNNVKVTMTVYETVSVTLEDSQNAGTKTVTCNAPSCEATMTGVGANAGSITLIADGQSTTYPYPAK